MNQFLNLFRQNKWQHFRSPKTNVFLLIFLALTTVLGGCSEGAVNETSPLESSQTNPVEVVNNDIQDPGNNAEELVPEGAIVAETENELANLQQDWVPNSGDLRPIPNTLISAKNPPLAANNLGAWQTDINFGYGFTLTNTSSDHYVANTEYQLNAYDSDGNLLRSKVVGLRDLFPLEEVNVGEVIDFGKADNNYGVIDHIEVLLIAATPIEIEETPDPLQLKPSIFEPPVSVGQVDVSGENEGPLYEDDNQLNLNFGIFNPNGAHIASNTTFFVTVFDVNGNVLGQSQGTVGDILPRQLWALSGSIYIQTPELIENVELKIEPEQFTSIDPALIPSRLISDDQITFSGQQANITFSGEISSEFHLSQIRNRENPGKLLAIAYNSNGSTIGGGFSNVFPFGFDTSALTIHLLIRASNLPEIIEIYNSYDVIEYIDPRGGGGGHPGRDNFGVNWIGIEENE